MPDYKEMYLMMVRAAERAQRILIEAQRYCEEQYLASSAEEAGETTSQPGLPLRPGAESGD